MWTPRRRIAPSPPPGGRPSRKASASKRRGVVDGHCPLMDAEGGGESGHRAEGVEVDADGESGVVCPEAPLHHQLPGGASAGCVPHGPSAPTGC
jgi:hypothetical protein